MQITDRFEVVPVAEITPDKRNTRKHSDDQIKELRRSLREFGFVNPLLIDKAKKIIAGHGRLTAAIAEGMTAVPCIFVEHLTEAQRRAYMLADGTRYVGYRPVERGTQVSRRSRLRRNAHRV